jgi:NAD(P)-dependent dehydrogenase (short-subunit alcohol dehydrogenase family)
VTQETGRQAVIDAALERHGRIDALVNNAGSALQAAAFFRFQGLSS